MVKRICIICGKEYSAYEEPNKSRGSRQLKELKDKNEI